MCVCCILASSRITRSGSWKTDPSFLRWFYHKKVAWEKAQDDVEILAWPVEEPKKMADKLTTQVPSLEDQVKHLDNKLIDSLTELHDRELCPERTTAANDDLQCQVTRQRKKSESKLMFPLSLGSYASPSMLLIPLPSAEIKAKRNALKAMVENVVAFFYPDDPDSAARAPQLLDGLLTQS
jgi:hypothetical protein